jgi:hypothetical protein
MRLLIPFCQKNKKMDGGQMGCGFSAFKKKPPQKGFSIIFQLFLFGMVFDYMSY